MKMSLVALVVALAVLLGALLGIFGADPQKVPITIGLFQVPSGCQVLTFPASPEAAPKQDVEWAVAGRCDDIDPANIEVKFVAKDGCSGTNPLDSATLKGKKFKSKVKKDAAETTYCYGIYNGSTLLEDPDLDIRKR